MQHQKCVYTNLQEVKKKNDSNNTESDVNRQTNGAISPTRYTWTHSGVDLEDLTVQGHYNCHQDNIR